jgi:feruloyl esterase
MSGTKIDREAMRTPLIIFIASCSSLLAATRTWSAEDACRALTGRDIAAAHITGAALTAPGWSLDARGYSVAADRPLCRVTARIEETINIELWLPTPDAWNARLLGAGVGGSAGDFNYRGLARGASRGFATASTDTGHSIDQKDWMLNRQAAENYAHRAVHLMTEASKGIIAAYYGKAPTKSYFMGCSGGGRQGLKEIERYPQDYDGVLAGAPGANMPLLSVRHMMTALAQQRAEAKLDPEDWKLLARRSIQACDALDGVIDGVVDDPRRCSFDLAAIECSAGQSESCLSSEKISLIRSIVAPLRDEHGQLLDHGLLPGVSARPGPPPSLLLELFGQGVHHDAAWDPQNFVASVDLAAVYRELPELRADEAHLHRFQSLGHKAILYQGWMDPSVLAQSTIDYYNSVVADVGSLQKTQEFLRLFLVPGMLHCGGGNSTDQFGGEAGSVAMDADHDALSALVRWVESGQAPTQMLAGRTLNGVVVRTRPLCAFPAVAKYRGSGDIVQAASFDCSTSIDTAVGR